MNSLFFTMIKEQYDWKWSGANDAYVASFVKEGAITPDQYQKITGQAYVA